MINRISVTGTPEDSQWVLAVMYFPEDEHLRRSWYTVQVVSGWLKGLKTNDQIQLDRRTLTDLMDAPAFEELKLQTVKAVKKGVVAGDVLACIYLMDRFQMSEPSINKAVHVIERFAADVRYGDSTPMNKSRKKIREAFKKYKSVAHLWAASRLNRAYPYADESELLIEKLPLFLEVSAGLLEFGRAFIPYRARPAEPILPVVGMWELPENTMVRHLSSETFPTELRRLLEDYDATEYQY